MAKRTTWKTVKRPEPGRMDGTLWETRSCPRWFIYKSPGQYNVKVFEEDSRGTPKLIDSKFNVLEAKKLVERLCGVRPWPRRIAQFHGSR